MALPRLGFLKYKQPNGEWKFIGTVFQGQYGDIVNFDKTFTAQDFEAIPVNNYGYRSVSFAKAKDAPPSSPFTTDSPQLPKVDPNDF
jgi:hypothetical protein